MVTIVAGALGLSSAAMILFLVRHDRLQPRHALGWLVIALGCAVIGLAPGLVDAIAGWLGIGYPPTLAIAIALAALLIKTLLLDIEFAQQEVRLQRMAQRLAILESRLPGASSGTVAPRD
jgi:hypothetical protein